MLKFCKALLPFVVWMAFGCAPSARAGTWQGPVYVISQRNGAARGTDAALPVGGGGSTVQGRIRAQGPLASGTVTARFTWLPAPHSASDPPPTTLTIAEMGSASWREVYSRSKMPSTLGMADNGLGHPALTNGGGRSGSSSGILLRTYRVINGSVTTKPVTLKAVASPAGNTYWRYSARVSPFSIALTCNGEVISDSWESGAVTPPTPFQFVAEVSSHGLPVSHPQWTLSTSRFAYDTGDDHRPLTDADLQHYSLNAFYVGFVPQSSALPIYLCDFCQPAEEDVMFTVNINGQPYSVRGKVHPYYRRA